MQRIGTFQNRMAGGCLFPDQIQYFSPSFCGTNLLHPPPPPLFHVCWFQLDYNQTKRGGERSVNEIHLQWLLYHRKVVLLPCVSQQIAQINFCLQKIKFFSRSRYRDSGFVIIIFCLMSKSNYYFKIQFIFCWLKQISLLEN